ncbi:Eukaryotic translation initiation factor 2D [Rhizophlyctis rosea]|nr:Eukaryotic translation initiation factor 2D [Rhizophlyctis rosea]
MQVPHRLTVPIADDEAEEAEDDTAQASSKEALTRSLDASSLNDVPEVNESQVPAQEEPAPDEPVQEAAIIPAEMDDLLQNAFLSAMKSNTWKDPKILPMSSTILYSSHILPAGNDIDVKKSTYKKVGKFLKAMEKKGMIKLKERGGDVLLMSVNQQHPMIQNHEDRHRPKEKKKPKEQSNGSASAPGGASGSATETLSVTELYKGTSAVNRVFNEIGLSDSAYYTVSEVRNAVNDFAKEKDLTDKRNPRMVKIEALLCDAVLAKDEYNSIDYLPRDEIVRRMLNKMQEFHQIKLPNQDAVVKKGALKPVQVVVEQRQGRKTVTKITAMEQFGVNPDDLASQLKVRCASSTTVTPLPTKANAPPLHEVLVQGSKVKEVFECLGQYGIPFTGVGGPNVSSKFVEMVDKTKKK